MGSTNSSWEHLIRRDLLDNYDRKVRPVLRGKKNVKVQFALRISRLVKVVSKAYSYKIPISWNSVFWAFFFFLIFCFKSHNNNFSTSHWPGNVLLFLFKSSKFVVVIKVRMKFKIYQEATELSTDTRGLFYNHTKGRAFFHPPPPLPSLPRPLTSIPLPPPLSPFTRNSPRYHASSCSYLKIASILCPLFCPPPPFNFAPLTSPLS